MSSWDIGRGHCHEIGLNRSSHRRCSVRTCNFIKKETLAQVFSCEFHYAHLNRDSVSLVDMGVTYRAGIVATYLSAIPPVVVNGSNHHRRWSRVSPGITRYAFANLGRKEGWVGLATRGGREICWYDLHGESNPGISDSRTPHGCFYLDPICFMWILNYRLTHSGFWVLS